MDWTVEQDATLLKAAADGLSRQHIADIVFRGERTRNMICGRLWRLGWRNPDHEAPATKKNRRMKQLFRAAIEEVDDVPPAPAPARTKAKPKMLAKPKPVHLPPPVEPESLNLPVQGLNGAMCRYPTKTEGRQHFFCGAPTPDVTHVWCRWHRLRVYQDRTAAQAMKRER